MSSNIIFEKHHIFGVKHIYDWSW